MRIGRRINSGRMLRTLAALAILCMALPAAAAPLVLVVHPSVPADTLQKLRELAGEQPRGLTFANAGIGSTAYRAAALFADRAHLELTHVPYRNAGTALAAVVAGEAAAMFVPTQSAAAAIRGGKLRALAVTGRKRLAELPDVPPFSEAGLAGFDPVPVK